MEAHMIIDCHYHLDTRIQSMENLIEKMDQNEIDKTALMPTMWDPPPETAEFALKLLRFLLYHRFFRPLAQKLAAKFSPEGDIILPKETVKIYQDPDNKSVADAMAEYPDRFIGWIFVNPAGKNNAELEYANWKDTPGFIGVKAHPFWHRFEPKELMPVAAKASQAGLPLLIHAGFAAHGDFMPLVHEIPGLKLILAHAGFPAYADTWPVIQDFKNVYVDLSADAYVDGKVSQQAVDFLGVERCLFGTDGPYGHRSDDGVFDNGRIKRRLERLFPDKQVQRQLLGENFRRMIDMP
jgi:predicted TIM-barrel fold metal-dependent hydrolase